MKKLLLLVFFYSLMIFCGQTTESFSQSKNNDSKYSLHLSKIFANEMVLQRDKPVPVWGKAKAGSKVTVSFSGQLKSTHAGTDGKWKIVLDPLKTNAKNQTLTVTSGSQKVECLNVLVGEVWLASGQSNMQWAMYHTNYTKDELKNLDEPLIRFITIKRHTSASPQTDVKGEWMKLHSSVTKKISSVAAGFAMELKKELNVPIGIISSNLGGTRIEPWTPYEGFKNHPDFQKTASEVKSRNSNPQEAKKDKEEFIKTVKNWVKKAEAKTESGEQLPPLPIFPTVKITNQTPSALYNAMIHPLVGFALRGVIWYQGESNMGEGLLYEKRMQALIRGWRHVWKQGDFPFYYVQLAPFGQSSGGRLAGIWEAQFRALKSIKNTGMVVTTDIGNLKSIHPKNKKDVSKRLALWALAKDYGKDIVYSGPLYKGFERKDKKVIISFDHAESGLGFKGKAIYHVFVNSKENKAFVGATPTIVGSTLVVTHPKGEEALHVRMGWNKRAQPNLMNKEGLPASPFRTDGPQ